MFFAFARTQCAPFIFDADYLYVAAICGQLPQLGLLSNERVHSQFQYQLQLQLHSLTSVEEAVGFIKAEIEIRRMFCDFSTHTEKVKYLWHILFGL